MISHGYFTLALVVSLLGISIGIRLLDLPEDEWTDFKRKFGKKYSNEVEERFRMKIYRENRQSILEHNQESSLHGYELGINGWADMLPSELSSFAKGYRNDLGNSARRNLLGASFIQPENVKIPDSVDWRSKGAVTPVKAQGECGSCWAFSATGALEGQLFRKTGKLVSLSEQNLVDCTRSSKYGNKGCNGGDMDEAFSYIKDNHGIDTEAGYPYNAKDGVCHYNASLKGGEDKGFVDLPSGDELKLQAAVASVGPISVAIDSNSLWFVFYVKGVFYNKNCNSSDDALDHGVLVVGYGTEEGKDYWLVKNSWGDIWGDQGYIKMSRNRNNNCGIATEASYPIV